MPATANSHTSTHPLRAGLATLALVGVCIVFMMQLDESYPLEHWLLFRYLKFWGLCAGVACACTVSGMRETAALGAKSLSFAENLLISFASGVLLFALGIFVGGMLGLYGPFFFATWPVLLTVLAGRSPWHTLTGAARSFGTQPDYAEYESLIAEYHARGARPR